MNPYTHVGCDVEGCYKPHNECGHDFFDLCGCAACVWDDGFKAGSQTHTVLKQKTTVGGIIVLGGAILP